MLREEIKELILNDDSADAGRCADSILSLIRERVKAIGNPYGADFYSVEKDAFENCRMAILEELNGT